MVATLKGTGLALDAAADVQAVRAALSAPVKGLGLAFGTSVAGVAASAMLGLMSALARRERLQAALLLDGQLHAALHPHTATFREEESLRLLRQQAEAVPLLVDRLQAMMATMERQAEALGARLSAQQEAFHHQTETAYAGLAASVDRGLQRSLTEAARAAGAALQPAVDNAMAGLARQAEATHEGLSRAVQQQLDALSARVESMTSAVAGSLQAALSQQAQAHAGLLQDLRASLDRYADASAQRLAGLLASIAETQAAAQQQITESDRQRQAAWTDALQRTAQRDEAMLAERQDLLVRLATLLDSLQQASSEQRGAIDALVAGTTQASARVEAGAIEVSALGEAFHHAVQLFGDTAQRLGTQLQAIEQALAQSMARSDEQLEYCVAQAREVVDLTLMSQKQVLEDLRRLAGRQAAQAEA
jgi:DNA anti-recombination protein RmuC